MGSVWVEEEDRQLCSKVQIFECQTKLTRQEQIKSLISNTLQVMESID